MSPQPDDELSLEKLHDLFGYLISNISKNIKNLDAFKKCVVATDQLEECDRTDINNATDGEGVLTVLHRARYISFIDYRNLRNIVSQDSLCLEECEKEMQIYISKVDAFFRGRMTAGPCGNKHCKDNYPDAKYCIWIDPDHEHFQGINNLKERIAFILDRHPSSIQLHKP